MLSRAFLKIFATIIILVLVSCIGFRTKSIYLGNFIEKQYSFFDSFRHVQDSNYYQELPFRLKFGGIRTGPYSWLRKSENLERAFNAFDFVGLEKLVSKEMYFKKNEDWCCDTQWERKSLNDVVKGYLESDTAAIDTNYYSKFWSRRRKEKLVSLTYSIFSKIDAIYNERELEKKSIEQDSVLSSLLKYDVLLMNASGGNYDERVLEYFNYLKSVELDYSAYKLVCNNVKVDFDQQTKDSLVATMKHDTLNTEQFQRLNDNRNGWISPDYYPDPNRFYGP